MDTLEAGRNLDVLVADQVMGYQKRAIEGRLCLVAPELIEWFGDDEEKWNDHAYWWPRTGEYAKFSKKHGFWIPSQFPRYSTDIAAAWQVVERMQKMDDDTFERFKDEMTYTDGSTMLLDEFAAVAAHDICCAALAAVNARPVSSSAARRSARPT